MSEGEIGGREQWPESGVLGTSSGWARGTPKWHAYPTHVILQRPGVGGCGVQRGVVRMGCKEGEA